MLVSVEMPLDPLFVKLPKYPHARLVSKYEMYPAALHPRPAPSRHTAPGACGRSTRVLLPKGGGAGGGGAAGKTGP